MRFRLLSFDVSGFDREGVIVVRSGRVGNAPASKNSSAKERSEAMASVTVPTGK